MRLCSRLVSQCLPLVIGKTTVNLIFHHLEENVSHLRSSGGAFRSLLWTAIPCTNEDTWLFSFLSVPFCFSPQSCSSKNPGTGLSEWTEWTPGLVPDFSGSALDFSPFPIMLAIVFWYTT